MFVEQTEHLYDKLIDRRKKLSEYLQDRGTDLEVYQLLKEVDAALDRMKNGSFGICEVCHDPIEPDRLEADPLLKFCIDHLTTKQQRNLEDDLVLAAKIQRNLLPSKDVKIDGWEISYHYEPSELVSGDYCDIVKNHETEPFYLVVGDVTGKGIAAAMLMNHLHAMLHSLIPLTLSSEDLMERMNRVLCESILEDQFATLLLTIVHENGLVKISNAGHCLPILYKSSGVEQLDSTGIPLGVLCGSKYSSTEIRMRSGDVLFLYTDGLIEAMRGDEQFGIPRLLDIHSNYRDMSTREILDNTLSELNSFIQGAKKEDDLTIMVLKKR